MPERLKRCPDYLPLIRVCKQALRETSSLESCPVVDREGGDAVCIFRREVRKVEGKPMLVIRR